MTINYNYVLGDYYPTFGYVTSIPTTSYFCDGCSQHVNFGVQYIYMRGKFGYYCTVLCAENLLKKPAKKRTTVKPTPSF